MLHFLFRSLPLRLLAAACLLAPFAGARAQVHVPDGDVPGSHDSPIVSRFAGSVIVGYSASDYDQLVLPMGATRNRRLSATDTVEGRITRIAYVAPEGKSALEVFRNFEAELDRAGFRSRFGCHGDKGKNGCGSGFDMARALLLPVQDRLGADLSALHTMSTVMVPHHGNLFVRSERLERPQGRVDLSLLVSGREGTRVGVLLQIAESKAMARGQVQVDAKAMSNGLANDGHIALYGITFATDSATLSASGDTLDQMHKLLEASPGMKVYIVGHSDNTGSLEHNLALSQKRAEAVVAALVAQGVPGSRLAAKGMADYAPVASNHTEAGRARNRRVELVEQ